MKKIADKNRFKTRLLSFLEEVIKYKLRSIDTNKVLLKIRLPALAAKGVFIFTFQLKDHTNLIISRI